MSALLASVAAGRSALYWMLADLFLTVPNDALVHRLARDLPTAAQDQVDTARDLAALRATLPREPADVATLADEYKRLFGGLQRNGGPVPPRESLHRTIAARETPDAFYAKAGLAAFEPGAPPDHLGVEFRFMALMCHGESAAWRAGRIAEARGALANERDFLDWHVLAWAPSYLATLEREARQAFYRVLAAIAAHALVADRTAIEQILNEGG